MIRRWLISIIIICFAAVGAVVWQRHARTVPWDECSEVYRQYAHADGIEATFVHDYPVCDTLSVDVTILQATDSAGWQQLRKDIRITDYEENMFRHKTEAGINIMVICGAYSTENQYVVASMRDRYACVFHTSNLGFRDQIKESIIEQTLKTTKHNKKLLHYEEIIH